MGRPSSTASTTPTAATRTSSASCRGWARRSGASTEHAARRPAIGNPAAAQAAVRHARAAGPVLGLRVVHGPGVHRRHRNAGHGLRSEERRVGKEGVGRVDLGGRRIFKKNKKKKQKYTTT